MPTMMLKAKAGQLDAKTIPQEFFGRREDHSVIIRHLPTF